MRDDITKHTLNLRAGDWNFLESMFRPKGVPTSIIIRTLISQYVDKHRAGEPVTKLNVETQL